MPLSIYAQHHDLPPSCVLALPEKERQPGQECTCDGGVKHTADWVKLKGKLSYGEKVELAERMSQSAAAGLCWMLERFIVEWSLKDNSTRLVNQFEGAKGEPLPVTMAVIYDLDEETADYLGQLTEGPKKTEGDGGPKASKPAGGRSPKR